MCRLAPGTHKAANDSAPRLGTMVMERWFDAWVIFLRVDAKVHFVSFIFPTGLGKCWLVKYRTLRRIVVLRARFSGAVVDPCFVLNLSLSLSLSCSCDIVSASLFSCVDTYSCARTEWTSSSNCVSWSWTKYWSIPDSLSFCTGWNKWTTLLVLCASIVVSVGVELDKSQEDLLRLEKRREGVDEKRRQFVDKFGSKVRIVWYFTCL